MRHVLAGLLIAAGAAGYASQALAQAKPAVAAAPKPWAQLGRVATPDEIKAWDIDVRADFKGLPAGSGSVDKGQEVWEAKCASCHGIFGESTEVFTPIVGGTTKEDIKTGRVANLTRPDYPQRTTMMKVSQVSTLWDYINRAMPWNAPKSLKTDEVYAVLAYILSLAEVVPEDFTLSDKNIAEVQQRMPNRNGKLAYTEMWKVSGKPDVQGSTCMKNCATDMDVRSMLPEHARDSHGNLAEQNRVVGPFRGADTLQPPNANPAALAKAATTKAASETVQIAKGTAQKPGDQIAKDANCLACHALDRKLVGPSFKEVAEKYKGDAKAPEMLAAKIRNGGQGVWGAIPMPGNPQLSAEDLQSVVKWILQSGR
ncbi:MAG: c-type cytochrome [Quisquiliibacterium sp.]